MYRPLSPLLPPAVGKDRPNLDLGVAGDDFGLRVVCIHSDLGAETSKASESADFVLATSDCVPNAVPYP